MLESVQWYGHASFCICGSPRIMIDPWSMLYEGPAPDVILISHEHYDHCSPGDVNKLRGAHTRIIASRTAAQHLDGDITVLRPWQVINIGRTSIKAVPAYTFSGDHPAHRDDLGFVISRDYTDIYYAGDTDFIPELRNMCCDIAILPISNGRDGIMPTESAAQFVKQVQPRFVIPSHIGNQIHSGSKLDLQAFERALSDKVEIVKLPLAGEVAIAR